jgi:glycosyltransferase involved in cell wall biosynthesis
LAPSKGKVLLVTETPPGTPNGFGVTLQCMFRDTPHEVLYTDAAFREHGDSNGFTLAQVPYHRSRKHVLAFLTGRIPEWRNHFSKIWLRAHLTEKHLLVYAFVYSTNCLLYASWIAKKRNLPLLVHLADHSDAFEQPSISRILENCTKLICITEDMRSKYESMLGRKDIEFLHNGAEDQCFQIPSPTSLTFDSRNPFVFCFLGGLFSQLHGECIEDVLLAVKNLRTKFPFLEFHLYGQLQPKNFLSELLHSQGITHHGIIMPLDKKYEIMERAHCFLIPSSFNPDKNSNYRYSFPTKLPELLGTGRPVLSYGPENTASNRILGRHKLGFRIHNRSVKNLEFTLSSIIEDYTQILNDQTSRNKEVIQSFSATMVRSKLTNILTVS